MKETVIAAASSYNEKFFLNDAYNRLPKNILDELTASVVALAASIGGMATISVVDNQIVVLGEHSEDDFDFDEIHARFMVDMFVEEKQAFLEQLLTFHRLFVEEGSDILRQSLLNNIDKDIYEDK